MSTTDETTNEQEQENGETEFNEEIQVQDEATDAGEWLGDTSVSDLLPSERFNPYMSEEDQEVEMKPVVVGPPAYASPDPATAAGRLLPLEDHPLHPDNVAEGAEGQVISEDYATDVQGMTLNAQSGTAPISPEMTDLERDTAGLGGGETPAEGEQSYEDMTVAQLREEASSRGIEGTSNMVKADLVAALEEDDAAAS